MQVCMPACAHERRWAACDRHVSHLRSVSHGQSAAQAAGRSAHLIWAAAYDRQVSHFECVLVSQAKHRQRAAART